MNNSPIQKLDPKTRSVSMVVPLTYPIMIEEGGKQVQVYQLEITRLKVKHLRMLPSSFFDDTITEMPPSDARLVVIAFTNLPAEKADEIDLKDAATIIGVGRELLK
jgi:hypothetical protein